MDNPNAYDDGDYARWASETDTAIGGLWDAGASIDNIEETVANAVENATGSRVTVSIQPA